MEERLRLASHYVALPRSAGPAVLTEQNLTQWQGILPVKTAPAYPVVSACHDMLGFIVVEGFGKGPRRRAYGGAVPNRRRDEADLAGKAPLGRLPGCPSASAPRASGCSTLSPRLA